ncbi:MAG: LPXTG cell wall anchor domain-containing protein [Clostridia bacterium]|nr:LPXTG cell wall anchor domain-containing protein [Clostridia bacterium]
MMGKHRISIIIILVMLLQLAIPLMRVEAVIENKSKEEILNDMTTKEKIAQMLMPAFRTYDGTNVTTLNEEIEGIIAKHGFAGVILFAQNNSSTTQTLELIDSIQKANIKNEDRPELLISVDQEGATVTRLAEGTQGPGNMALGATGDSKNAYSIGEIIGLELKSIGYNVDFAPVVDVNNNPSNPVIGNRSFSDDANIVVDFGSKFMKGLKSQSIITSLKHFPGHGDTSTDSHTGLPRIEKTYNQLKQNELIPFTNCIENGAEMIMTAHIQYPKIETETYTSIKDGNEIELPATLSKKIITDILRNDLDYDGVVVTDAMNMQAISDNFDKLDSAKLAINAGVDIILMPVDILNKEGIEALDKYITDVADLVDNGEISVENVNNAVLRILTLKENNGLLGTYDDSNLETRINNAKKVVGSKENHDTEWEIAKKSITLVKNDTDMLPIQNNGKTVILVPYANEVLSGEYAISKLKEDGIISKDMDISVLLIRNKELAEIEDTIADAKNVILITEQYSQAGLAGASYEMADSIIDFVHEQGNKISCISCYLPYDVARLQKADSILLAYSANGMNELPNFENDIVKTYGVSIPCGIYTAFNKNAKLGKLPVNIPELDDNYKYTSEYLYKRNYGLQYEEKEEYKFIEGQEQSFNITTDSKLKFEFNIEYDVFIKQGNVHIDNELVDSSNYALSKGSTIITFNDEYTKLLATGEHTLKVAVNDGEIETKFTITKIESPNNNETTNPTSDDTTKSATTIGKSSGPKTGDNIVMWATLLVVSMLGLAGTVKLYKKNK